MRRLVSASITPSTKRKADSIDPRPAVLTTPSGLCYQEGALLPVGIWRERMRRFHLVLLGLLVGAGLLGCGVGEEKKEAKKADAAGGAKIPVFEDNFGHAVAAAGDVNKDGFADVIAGAWGTDTTGPDAGAAYIFLGGPQGIKSRSVKDADIVLRGEAKIDYFGFSVGGNCDLNGDGYADVFVGAPLSDKGAKDAGAVYVFYGGPKGPGPTPGAVIAGLAEGDQFGHTVACGGDLNGDGIDDLVVGAPLEDLNIPGDLSGPDTGAVYIFYGSKEGIKATSAKEANHAIRGVAAGDWFGNSISRVGDVRKDGRKALLVGAYRNAPGPPESFRNAGAAYLFFAAPKEGIKADRASKADALFKGAARWDNFGASVFWAGDVNRDGHADVVIGADENDQPGKLNAGGVYVYHGSPRGIGGLPDAYIYGDKGGDYLGTSVAGGGDFNKDGFGDVVVGARESSTGAPKAGAVFVFYGGKEGVAEGPAGSAKTVLTGAATGDNFGFSVAILGDVNGDGYADVIVGAPGHEKSGAAFIFYGGKDGIKSRKASEADAILLGRAK
jgi:hypothetical protein